MWNDERLIQPLAQARHEQGRLLGSMSRVGFALNLEAQLEVLTEDALSTSEIEGEHFARASVRSSLARHLGIEDQSTPSSDRRAEGIITVIVDATEQYCSALTTERLFGWHAALFPTGYAGNSKIGVAAWRDDKTGPMQVISGPIGRRTVHYQAPTAMILDAEMQRFITWFNEVQSIDSLLRAAIAHLWFVTLHPFDDGNGRIARALTDMALAQSENSSRRFYSMSRQICKERTAYYTMLERTQKGTLDITEWLLWFLSCFSNAIAEAEILSKHVFFKADFWQRHMHVSISERQKNVLNRYLSGFIGKLTTKKWAILGKCSLPTAQRDINELIEHGMLIRNDGGSKNTSYDVS